MFHVEKVCNEYAEKISLPGRKGFVQITPTKSIEIDKTTTLKPRPCVMPGEFEHFVDRVHEVNVRADDVWVVTYPKSGTTWLQEMLWLVLSDFDFTTAKKIDLLERSPFLEFSAMIPCPISSITMVQNLPSPRLIKSHLPAVLLPRDIWSKKAKVFYVARNPGDVAVSFYHHWRGMSGYKGSKEDFIKAFITGNVSYTPYWDHVLEFWSLREQPNVMFLTYEEMKKDLAGVIRRCCKFLNKSIIEEQISKMLNHLSFENMKENRSCNHTIEKASMLHATGLAPEKFEFIRKGAVEGYKEELPNDVITSIKDWIHEAVAQSDFKAYDKPDK